jgi:hypothetical protein
MSTPSTTLDGFTTITLGRSANAIELLVPTAPSVHDNAGLKARSFDYLSDLLFEHAPNYTSAELIAAFNHIPGNTYNAVLESAGICKSLQSAFFQIDNLVGLGFRHRDGSLVTSLVTPDVATRPSGLYYFAFRSTVAPSTIDSRILHNSFTIEFCLALPQTNLSQLTSTAAASIVPANLFATPATAPHHPTLTTYADLEDLSAAALALLGSPHSSDKLSDYSRDCFSKFSRKQVFNLAQRDAAQPIFAPAPAPPAPPARNTPRMTAALASGHPTGGHSFYGSLEFLDDQSMFDKVFPHPVPLLLSSSSTGSSLNSASVCQAMTTFIDQCKFQLFVPLFRTDYVGTANRNDAASLRATIIALKKLRMSTRLNSGQWINLTPDDLFAAYSALTPLLPADVSLWGCNLITQYHDSLIPDLQDLISSDINYHPPNLATLTTRSTQLSSLRTLRLVAVRHYTIMRNQERMVARSLHKRLTKQPPGTKSAFYIAGPDSVGQHLPFASGPDPSAPTRVLMSPAEQTMQRYQPASTEPPVFPMDPLTNFVSTLPAGFRGCLFCESADHTFKECPQNKAPGAAALFYKNLFAHKPHLRKRPPFQGDILPPPVIQSFSAASVPPTPTIPIPDSQSTLPPSILRPPQPPPAGPPAGLPADPVPPPPPEPMPPPGSKRARFFIQLVRSFPAGIELPTLPPMPIAIDNGLPHVTFTLGCDRATDPSLCGLMDTCGALNTGYLLFHQWVMSERPDIVAEYLEFDASNPFEPVKLGGAIRDPANVDLTDHGNLTAVIRYYTPYADNDGNPITLSFALGPDVTVNTIFGLPMLCALDSVISLRSNTMHSRTLNHDFPISRVAATHGLPAHCSFDPATADRAHAASTILPSHTPTPLPTPL